MTASLAEITHMTKTGPIHLPKGGRAVAVEVQHLAKTFGKHETVKDLSFTIDKGEIFGLLGLNAAGKSTTIHPAHWKNITRLTTWESKISLIERRRTIMTSTLLREHIALRKLLWVGPLIVASTVGVNLIIRTIAVSIFGVPETFHYLQAPTVIGSTVVFVLAALLTLVLVNRFAQRPIHTFWVLAFVVLCISFLSPVMALVGLFPAPGMTLSIFWTMIVMHIVSAIIIVGLITTLTLSKHNNFNAEEIKVRHEVWPDVLMLCGFGAAAIFLGLLLFANLSPTLNVVANIAESISIGIGSIGLGSRIAQARRKNKQSRVRPIEQ